MLDDQAVVDRKTIFFSCCWFTATKYSHYVIPYFGICSEEYLKNFHAILFISFCWFRSGIAVSGPYYLTVAGEENPFFCRLYKLSTVIVGFNCWQTFNVEFAGRGVDYLLNKNF